LRALRSRPCIWWKSGHGLERGDMLSLTKRILPVFFVISILASFISNDRAGKKKIRIFILSGQSNMVGQGLSNKIPKKILKGIRNVLMFEDGKWQKLEAIGKHKKYKVPTFGPEIGFSYYIQKAWPDERIGIVKQAWGGTGVLAWHPEWSKEEADRTKDGKKGNLWKALMEKVKAASKAADCEYEAFLWLQGGKDMKYDTGKEYLNNLKALLVGLRKEFKKPKLPLLVGSYRLKDFPDDLDEIKKYSGAVPNRPYAWNVLQGHYLAARDLPPAKMVALRDIERHPQNVHFNTKGLLLVGQLFADAFLELTE